MVHGTKPNTCHPENVNIRSPNIKRPMRNAPLLLAPIPEDSDPAPVQAVLMRSDSAISTADTPPARKAPIIFWPHCKEWPANREVRGEMTLRCSANHRRSMLAVCSVRDGVLTMNVRSAGNTAVVVEVPVVELAVGLQKESVEVFTVDTLPENRMYDADDEIYCFVDNQVKRNKWIAVFRRMGVPIFDLSYGHAKALQL
jgi:hypothetical protein